MPGAIHVVRARHHDAGLCGDAMTLWFAGDEVEILWEASDEVATRWEGSDEVFDAGAAPPAGNDVVVTVGRWPGISTSGGMSRPTMPFTFGLATPNAVSGFEVLAILWGQGLGLFARTVRLGTTKGDVLSDFPTSISFTIGGTTYRGVPDGAVAQRATAQLDYTFRNAEGQNVDVIALLGYVVGSTHTFTFNFE